MEHRADRRVQRENKDKSGGGGLYGKIYPFRHCLMIGGGILIVLDIGLFIGGISIIASGIDMDIYGFAAMIAFSVLTMIVACLALICGYRSRPSRTSAYHTTEASRQKAPPQLITTRPQQYDRPKKHQVQSTAAAVPHYYHQPIPASNFETAPAALAAGVKSPAERHPPPPRRVVTMVKPPADNALSECSVNATWGGSGSTVSTDLEVVHHKPPPPNTGKKRRHRKRETDV